MKRDRPSAFSPFELGMPRTLRTVLGLPSSWIASAERQIWAALSGSIHVGPVLDPKDGDGRSLVVDLVNDAIGASSRRPKSRQFALQWVTDSSRVLAQRPDHELDDCGSDAFG
jgi:hypothetical protein